MGILRIASVTIDGSSGWNFRRYSQCLSMASMINSLRMSSFSACGPRNHPSVMPALGAPSANGDETIPVSMGGGCVCITVLSRRERRRQTRLRTEGLLRRIANSLRYMPKAPLQAGARTPVHGGDNDVLLDAQDASVPADEYAQMRLLFEAI